MSPSEALVKSSSSAENESAMLYTLPPIVNSSPSVLTTVIFPSTVSVPTSILTMSVSESSGVSRYTSTTLSSLMSLSELTPRSANDFSSMLPLSSSTNVYPSSLLSSVSSISFSKRNASSAVHLLIEYTSLIVFPETFAAIV